MEVWLAVRSTGRVLPHEGGPLSVEARRDRGRTGAPKTETSHLFFLQHESLGASVVDDLRCIKIALRVGRYVMDDVELAGSDSTHCRTGATGNTRSTRWAAVSAILLPAHEGHQMRRLHEKGRSRSYPQF